MCLSPPSPPHHAFGLLGGVFGSQREGALHADIEALQQTVSELQAQLQQTQLDGEAALRKQAAQAEADAGLKLHALGDESMAALAKLQQAKAAAEARVTALQAAAAAPVPQEFRVVYLGSEDGIIHAQSSASLPRAATQDGQTPMAAAATDPEDPADQANAPPLTHGAGTVAAADLSATPSGSNYLDLVVHGEACTS